MKTKIALVGLVCAVSMTAVASAQAADTAPPAAPVAAPVAKAAPAKARTPARAKTVCPAMPDAPTVSPEATRFFQTITDACVLRSSGLISDDQFGMIRDQAVNGIYNEMMAASNDSQTKMVASVK